MTTLTALEILGIKPEINTLIQAETSFPFDLTNFNNAQMETHALVGLVREGLPVKSVYSLQYHLGKHVTIENIAKVVRTSSRTLQAKRKTKDLLGALPTDRLLKLAEIVALAEETFDTKEDAKNWLITSSAYLHDESPFNYCDTDVGADKVKEMLLQIQYGIFS